MASLSQALTDYVSAAWKGNSIARQEALQRAETAFNEGRDTMLGRVQASHQEGQANANSLLPVANMQQPGVPLSDTFVSAAGMGMRGAWTGPDNLSNQILEMGNLPSIQEGYKLITPPNQAELGLMSMRYTLEIEKWVNDWSQTNGVSREDQNLVKQYLVKHLIEQELSSDGTPQDPKLRVPTPLLSGNTLDPEFLNATLDRIHKAKVKAEAKEKKQQRLQVEEEAVEELEQAWNEEDDERVEAEYRQNVWALRPLTHDLYDDAKVYADYLGRKDKGLIDLEPGPEYKAAYEKWVDSFMRGVKQPHKEFPPKYEYPFAGNPGEKPKEKLDRMQDALAFQKDMLAPAVLQDPAPITLANANSQGSSRKNKVDVAETEAQYVQNLEKELELTTNQTIPSKGPSLEQEATVELSRLAPRSNSPS